MEKERQWERFGTIVPNRIYILLHLFMLSDCTKQRNRSLRRAFCICVFITHDHSSSTSIGFISSPFSLATRIQVTTKCARVQPSLTRVRLSYASKWGWVLIRAPEYLGHRLFLAAAHPTHAHANQQTQQPGHKTRRKRAFGLVHQAVYIAVTRLRNHQHEPRRQVSEYVRVCAHTRAR